MGVPAFFRWLANRYPCVMLDLLEGRERGEFDRSTNASLVKETSGDFARWVQVDNLFIDCNGVVHPCCHPGKRDPQPKMSKKCFDNVGQVLRSTSRCGATDEISILGFRWLRAAHKDESTARTQILCSAGSRGK